MAQRVELGYKVTVEGKPELDSLAQSQRAVKQSVQDTSDILSQQDKAFEKSGASADIYSRKMAAARQAAFKRGEIYDPELAEEARIKSVAQAHAQLDAQIQRGQLAQLSGLQRLRAERDIQLRDLSKLGDPRLLDKVNQSFFERINALGASRVGAAGAAESVAVKLQATQKAERDAQLLQLVAGQRAGGGGSSSFGASSVLGAASNPGRALASGAEESAAGFGAAATSVTAIGAALALAVGLTVSLVHSQAEYAQQISNTASRLDISREQMLGLSTAARVAGVNVTSLEQSSRILSQALEDPAGAGKKVVAELNKLGISVHDSNGQMRESGPVLLDLLDKLNGVTSSTERMAIATRVLSRGAKEIEPLIARYGSLKNAVNELGLAGSGALIKSLSEDEEQFNRLGAAFDGLKLKLAGSIAPIVIKIVTQLTDAASSTKGEDIVGGIGGLSLLGINPALGVAGYLIQKRLREQREAAEAPDLQVGDGKQFVSDKDKASRSAAADAYTKAHAGTEQGLEQRKQELQKSIADADSKLRDPGLAQDARGRIGPQQNKDQGELRQVEERLKQLHKDKGEYEKLKQEVAGYQKSADQFELTGIEKIQAKYKELIDTIKKAAADKTITKGQASQLTGAASAAEDKEIAQDNAKQAAARIREQIGLTEQLIALQAKPGDELHTIQAKFQATNANIGAQFATGGLTSNDRDKELAKAKNERDKTLLEFYGRQILESKQQTASLATIGVTSQESLFEKQRNFNPFGVFNQSDEENRARDISASRQGEIQQQRAIQTPLVGSPAAARDAQKKSAEEDARLAEQLLDIRLRGEQDILQVRREQIATSASDKARLAQATGNPEDQVANVQALHDIKMEALRQELALTGNEKEFRKNADQEEADRIIKLSELRQQEAEKFKSTITEGILALQNGGRDGLGKFAQNFAKGIESKIIGNAAGVGFNILQPLFPQIGGQHEKNADGSNAVDKNGNPKLTFIGQLLKGTPFGDKGDPAKLATDQNTLETKLNTKAIEDLNAKLLARTGPGSIPGALATAAVQAAGAAKESSCGCGPGATGAAGALGGFANLFGRGTAAGTASSVSSSVFYGSDGLPIPGTNAFNPSLFPSPSFGTPDVSSSVSYGADGLPIPGTGPFNPDVFPSADSDEDGGSDTSGLPAPGSGAFNPATLPSVSSIPSALQTTFKDAGAAGAIAGGIFGVVSGIEKGGAKGDVSAIGSGLGAAAGVAALIPGGQLVAGALALGSLVTKLIGSFLGDPRQDRAKQEQQELENDRYVKPNSINVTENTAGDAAFTNATGALTTLKGAPLVQLYNQILGIDPLNPNHLLSATNQQLSTSTQALPSDLNPNIGGSKTTGTGSTTTASPITVVVQAMDSKSFQDNSGNIADAVSKAMRDGHRISSDIINRVRPN